MTLDKPRYPTEIHIKDPAELRHLAVCLASIKIEGIGNKKIQKDVKRICDILADNSIN